ncbi:MAG: hypothetical protein M3Y87_00300 [Myxococcota bacterium]|nr:hypothetical protein [Myxococcota bacterium]
MGRKKTDQKKADREAAEAMKAADQAAVEQMTRRRRVILAAVPAITALLALGAYFAFDDRRAVAVILVLGIAAWVPFALGSIGGAIPPRDRNRAGSIDFGRRD